MLLVYSNVSIFHQFSPFTSFNNIESSKEGKQLTFDIWRLLFTSSRSTKAFQNILPSNEWNQNDDVSDKSFLLVLFIRIES
jgi:hypothetical protein